MYATVKSVKYASKYLNTTESEWKYYYYYHPTKHYIYTER